MKLGPVPMLKAPYPCLDLVDSEFADHVGGKARYDRLALPEWQRWFLARWGWSAPLPAARTDLARLQHARDLVRAVLERAAPLQSLNALLEPAPFVHRVGEGGQIRLQPLAPGWDAVMARVALSAVELMTGPDADRVKVCANPSCSWMFYDESLNRSRRWCQANYCGNLVKVRAHRARGKRGGAPRPA